MILSNNKYVSPVEIRLGFNEDGKNCKFYYIPILQNLQKLFFDPQVQIQFLNTRSNINFKSDTLKMTTVMGAYTELIVSSQRVTSKLN